MSLVIGIVHLFPITVADLSEGQFVLCENGTTVLAYSDSTSPSMLYLSSSAKVINVENGCGGYPQSTKCRVLYNAVIFIATDEYGKSRK